MSNSILLLHGDVSAEMFSVTIVTSHTNSPDISFLIFLKIKMFVVKVSHLSNCNYVCEWPALFELTNLIAVRMVHVAIHGRVFK